MIQWIWEDVYRLYINTMQKFYMLEHLNILKHLKVLVSRGFLEAMPRGYRGMAIQNTLDAWIINVYFYHPLYQISFFKTVIMLIFLSCVSSEFFIYTCGICWIIAFHEEQKQQTSNVGRKITCIPGLFIWEAKFIGSLSRACNIRNMSTVSSLNLTCKENKPDH